MTNTKIVNHRKHWVNAYKVSNGCSNCGYNKHPSALCFDHMDKTNKSEHVKNGYSKRSSAGGMFRLYNKKHSTDELIEEIQKCRLLCHNCHMEKTHYKIKELHTTLFQRVYRTVSQWSFRSPMSIENLSLKLREVK